MLVSAQAAPTHLLMRSIISARWLSQASYNNREAVLLTLLQEKKQIAQAVGQ